MAWVVLSLVYPAAPVFATELMLGGSFEAPSLAGTTYGYCSLQPVEEPDLVSCVVQGVEATFNTFGPWRGAGNAYASGVGTAWAVNGAPPDGNQFAVLQKSSTFVQQVAIDTTGDYVLTWWDAGRAQPAVDYGGNQTYVVKIDGPTVVGTYSTITDQPFTPHSLTLPLSAGLHTIRFSGQVIDSDQSAYLDMVSLAPVPEPQAHLSLLLGLGALAAMARRRRTT